MAVWPDPRVQIQVGEEWADITADVRTHTPITITRGRSDEAARTDPARCTLELNNAGGRYSPRNPRSPYFGRIGRNTPLRVTVPGPTRLLLDGTATGVVSTPHTAGLNISGDLDLRAEVDIEWASGVNQVLVSKWVAEGGQRSYALRVLNGQLSLSWSEDGVSRVFAPVARLPQLRGRAAVRATLEADTGAGQWEVTFYSAPSLAGPWTPIGSPVRGSGTTSIHASTAPLRVGDSDPSTSPPRAPFAGSGYRFEVRDGINGPVAAAPDFTTQTPGTSGFTDSVGRLWTLEGSAEISDRRVRFVGEVASWPARWSLSGRVVWVPLEASGLLRRQGQGTKALDSTLRRRIPSDPALLAYWPMEEERDATQAYSPLPGVLPMVVSGIEFASDDSLAGSSALPKIGAAGSFGGQVPAAPAGAWHVECVYKIDQFPTQATLLQVRTTGTYSRLDIEVRPDNVRLYGTSTSAGASSVTLLMNLGGVEFTKSWNRLKLRAQTANGATTYHLNWTTIGETERGLSTLVTGVTAGRVTAVSCAPGQGLDQATLHMGHLAVFRTVRAFAFDLADDGFNPEAGWSRLTRLAGEEGLPLVISGVPADMMAMGPQRPEKLLDLLQQVADTDGGILGEQRDRVALLYRARTTLYSQPPALALDYNGPGLAPPLDPVDDDADVRNDIIVARIGGSSARAVLESGPLSVQAPPAGVGRYDESVSLSLAKDTQAEPIAWWRLWLGTQDQTRYPSVHVNLAAAPDLVEAATSVIEGDRITIANPPPWVPPETIDLIVQGQTETIQPQKWDITYNCSPGRPWNVAITDGGYRADTDGSQLAAAVDADDTALSVAVTAGPLWPTSPDELPAEVTIGGEQMTVTAITGTSSPQTWTVVRAVNGIAIAHAAGTAVHLARPAIAAL